MLDRLIGLVAPHRCYSCRKTGSALCDSCLYNIAKESFSCCFFCSRPTITGVCALHRSIAPFSHFFLAGERQDELRDMIDDYKFRRVYALHDHLASVLDAVLPVLPLNTIIVPLPTIAKHRRVRGYDHIDLIATALVKKRGLNKQASLVRKTKHVQRGADASTRYLQAKTAYGAMQPINTEIPHLIIDDVVTTGASLLEATRCLKQAGANHVMVAAIARQT